MPASDATDVRPTDMRNEIDRETRIPTVDGRIALNRGDTGHATGTAGAIGGIETLARPRPSRTAINEAGSREETTTWRRTKQETRIEDAGDTARGQQQAAGTRTKGPKAAGDATEAPPQQTKKTARTNRLSDEADRCPLRLTPLPSPTARSPRSPRKSPTLATRATSPPPRTR